MARHGSTLCLLLPVARSAWPKKRAGQSRRRDHGVRSQQQAADALQLLSDRDGQRQSGRTRLPPKQTWGK